MFVAKHNSFKGIFNAERLHKDKVNVMGRKGIRFLYSLPIRKQGLNLEAPLTTLTRWGDVSFLMNQS